MSFEGQMRQGVVVFAGPVPLPDGTMVRVEPIDGTASASAPAQPAVRQRTSLADWAEQNAEDWGDRLNSKDVESFTGRKF